MNLRIGGFAVTRGRTKAFTKLPRHSGDYSPLHMVTVEANRPLMLVDTHVRKEPSVSDMAVMEEVTLWKAWLGERTVWLYEEVLREPRKDEVPEEAWETLGL